MIGTRARLAVAMLGVVGGGVVGATSSDAAIGPECVGTAQAAVCVTVDPSALPTVNPTGGPGIQECIYAGPPPCTPVEVPTPSISPGSGSPVVVQCIGAVPCASNTDEITTVGNGTIAPGLTTSGCVTQTSVGFDSTLVVITGDDTSLTGPLHFDGSSSGCETFNSGQGSGNLAGVAYGAINYSRDGSVVTLTGTVTVNGEAGALTAGCVFEPTSLNPVTSYTLTCTGVLTS